MKETPVTFRSHGKQIVGMLHSSNRKKSPVIIFLHGWATGKYGNPQFTFVRAAREFSKKDFIVLRFDFHGVGDSEGNLDNYNQKTSLEDLDAAIQFVQTLKNVDKEKIGVLGWSMGGSTAIIGAMRNKKIKCVVSWAAPADEKDLWPPAMFQQLKRYKRIVVDFSTGLTTTLKSALEDMRWKASESIRKVRVPVLLINGTDDAIVYPVNAEKLYKNANKPKKIILISGANHGFYNESHKRKLFNQSLKWFDKWLR